MKVNISSEIVSEMLERKENIEYILGEICGYLDHKYCRKINFEFKLEGEKSETLGDSETLNETLEGEKSETLSDNETLNETLEDEKSETQGDDVIQKKDIVKIIKDMVEKSFISDFVLITNSVSLRYNNGQFEQFRHQNFVGTYYSWTISKENFLSWRDRI